MCDRSAGLKGPRRQIVAQLVAHSVANDTRADLRPATARRARSEASLGVSQPSFDLGGRGENQKPCLHLRKTKRCQVSAPTSGSLTRCTSSTSPTPSRSTRPGENCSRSASRAASPARPRPPTAARPAALTDAHQPVRRSPRRRLRPSVSEAPQPKATAPKPSPAAVRRVAGARRRLHSKMSEQPTPVALVGQPARSRRKSPLAAPDRQRTRGVRAHRAARRGGPHRGQHGHLADRPHGHQRPHGAGQAADRQPRRDQQPPGARPRRQGLVHPHHRLRDGQGAQGRCRR